MKEMYIMKIHGVNNMPDFVQIRDDQFTLISYFRADRPDAKRFPCGENMQEEKLKELIHELPYGQIRKIRC
jgi:hypothetical protein